jgi:hypothetical protein
MNPGAFKLWVYIRVHIWVHSTCTAPTTHVPATHCAVPLHVGMHGGGGATSTATMTEPTSTANNAPAEEELVDPLPMNSVFSVAFAATMVARL